MLRVGEVDWADSNIFRAGITPIYDDGVNKWIGLGVTKSRIGLTTIGGGFDDSDFDLLSTAVREYNEEIEDNYVKLEEGSVYDMYAVKTEDSIQILYPVKEKLTNFIPTDELYNILWVTTGQLSIIIEHQEHLLPPNNKSRAFVYGSGFPDICRLMINAVESGAPFTVGDEINLVRIRKIHSVSSKVFTNIEDLERDACFPGYFPGKVTMVITDKYICISRADGTIYKLDMSHCTAVASILKKMGRLVIVATKKNEARVFIRFGLKKQLVRSIEDLLNRDRSLSTIKREFNEKLQIIDKLEESVRINKELDLLNEYDEKCHNLIDKSKCFFNEKRAYFLGLFNMLNSMLSSGPKSLDELKVSLLTMISRKDITVGILVKYLSEIGLIRCNDNISNFYLI